MIDNTDRNDFLEQDPDGGYWLYAGNMMRPSGRSGSDVVRIGFCVGGKWVDHGAFEIGSEGAPREPGPSPLILSLYKGALLAIVEVWSSPPWANARCRHLGPKARVAARPGAVRPTLGFRGCHGSPYLCAERAAKLAALAFDLMTERTPDGGLLMTATMDRFDPTNPEHMRASLRLAEIMIEHGGNPSW